MSTHKRIDIICIAFIIIAIVLTLFLMGGRILGILPAMNQESGNGMFTAGDLNGDWGRTSATKIALSDKGSIISGNGAYVHEGNVYIAYAGHYVLTGELTDGSIIIDADKSDKIWLLLDGVTMHCNDDAAIRVEQADKVFLTLADHTENTISSGAQYDAEIVSSGVDGAIYSRDNLTINGKGSLAVDAEYYHGIVCNDDLAIAGGNITINAVQDGIHANDSVRIQNSVISVSAGDDGITVSNDDETAFLYIESGNITIADCYEGLEAVDITIAGGTIDIMATDDGINAAGNGENSVIRITDGDITITNPSGRDADGLDSNGSIYIEGGRTFISVSDSGGNCAIDYGSENGGECVVSGGTVIACGSSMMAEGFDAGSPQGFLLYNTIAEAGTTISLKNSEGRELLSEEIPYGFSSAILSVPELEVGDVCIIRVDDVEEQITIDNSPDSGFAPNGMFGNGMGDGRNRDRMPEGMEPPDRQNMERPDRGEDVLPVDNMFEPSDDSVSSENKPFDSVEPPEGQDMTDRQGMEPPNGMEPPDNGEFSDRTEMFDKMDMPGNERRLSDSQEIQENGVRPFYTFALLGISLLSLLIGLFIAMKTKH